MSDVATSGRPPSSPPRPRPPVLPGLPAHGTQVMTSRWRLDTAAHRVWPLLLDGAGWPGWWRCVRAVQPLAEPHHWQLNWQAPWWLPAVSTVQLGPADEAAGLVQAQVSGDLAGQWTWVLDARADGGCTVTFRWVLSPPAAALGPWLDDWLLLRLQRQHQADMGASAAKLSARLACRCGPVRQWCGGFRR